MATTTKSPEEERTDAEHNPSQELYDREFNAQTSPQNYNKSAEHPLGDSESKAANLRDAEKTSADQEKRAIEDTAAGKAAMAAGSAATGPVGTAVIKFLGKLKVKKLGIGSMIALFLVSTFVLISTFMGPGLLVVQVKETLADKYNDLFAAMDTRSTIIIKKKLDLTNGICRNNVKVLCRFNGFSKKQITAFERAGATVHTDGKTISGKARVTSIEMPDGTKVTASNLDSVLKNDFDTRRLFSRAFNPRYIAYADKVFDGLRIKLRLTKQKNVAGTTKEDLDKRMQNTLEGKNALGDDIGKIHTTTDADGVVRDQNGNPVSEADLNRMNEFNNAIENTTKELSELGKTASFSLAKSGFMALSGIGVVDGLCTAYNYLQLVGFGAKMIEAQQLVRFAFMFLNTGDMIKAGDATQEIVNYVARKMTDLNQYGQSFTDAYFYQYAAFGDLRFPKGGTDGETADMKNAITQFALGDGIAGTLTDIVAWLKEESNGAIDSVCKSVKSWWGQLGLIVLSIGATVLTGGANIGVGVFAFGSAQAAISVAMALALPKIMNMVAQTLVTTATVGGDAGNAATSGMAYLNAQNAAAHGLSPLTKDNVYEYQDRTNRIAAEYDRAERDGANPFDYMNPVTPAYAVATSINSQFSSPAKFLRNPLGIFQNAASSLFSPIARAADERGAEYNICEDKLYTLKNYAADPTCNIRYGLSDTELGFDPEDITEWMYANDFIDNEGQAIEGTEYAAYLDECMNRAVPLGSTGEDSQEGDGSICNSQERKYQYFRIFFVDDSIANSMDEEDNSADPVATTPPPTNSPTGWVWPITGKDESDVNWKWGQSTSRGIHKGIDIGAAVGTPIVAAHKGVVTEKSFDSNTCGRMYVIKLDGTNLWIAYQHLGLVGSRIPAGTEVQAGQKIGVLGHQGGTTCGAGNFYHLHFSVELTNHISTNSDPLSLSDDPLKYLP